MTHPSATDMFIEQLTKTEHKPYLISLLYYPHPFTQGGFLVVWQNNTPMWLERIALVQTYKPSNQMAYCLRQSELFFFAQPNLFAPALQVSERPHLPYYLQHKGSCLFGEDLRAEVQPANPNLLLAAHLEGCMDYLRRYGILTQLMQEKEAKLHSLLEREMRYLMGTALLLHNQWQISVDTLPQQFQPYFPQAYQTWFQITTTQDVIQAVWLFEQFLRQLRGHLS